MQQGPPMEVYHQNELAIVNASENRLREAEYTHCGNSIDLYQFSFDRTKEKKEDLTFDGHIFHANQQEDLTFGGEREQIGALNGSNKRKAVFRVHEAIEQQRVEDMIIRSLRLRHVGIGKAYVAGYNTQISEVVSGCTVPTDTLAEWLEKRRPTSYATRVSIPPEVQQLIRTVYLAIEAIWAGGYTSDEFANADTYYMVDDWVKIDPLRIRDRIPGEDVYMMRIRRAFSQMLDTHIYSIWEDKELKDLIDLLNLETARGAKVILGAPVLLSQHNRELMYHNYDKAKLPRRKLAWLEANAYPGDEWKNNASVDPALKSIIEYQEKNGDDDDDDNDGAKDGAKGFTMDFKGALHFGSVVTAHYPRHFKKTTKDPLNVDIKIQVDSVLKKVLPCLLSKMYNSEYAYRLDDKQSKDSSGDKDNRNLRPENTLSQGGRPLISEGLSPSSSMGSLSSDKSSLNPNAKEFKLNPNAKSFTPLTSPLRPPHSPVSDATYYYPNNMPANPGPGLPVGMGFPQPYGGQHMVYNAQPGSSPQGYMHPSGQQQYGQQMMMGQTYYPEMQQQYRGRNF